MKYCGSWNENTTYAEGDVVIYTDGVIYHLQKSCKAGITPVDTRCWSPLDKDKAEVIIMIADLFDNLFERVDGLENAMPHNINDEGITLKSGDDEYLVTVDASGDEPEVIATLIEEEGDGD